MNESVIQVRGLCVQFGRKVVLDGLDLDVPRGSVTALVGRNGVGKSTLLRLLAGLASPASGAVHLDGQPIAAMPARHRARHVGVLLEVPDATFGFTVRELVLLGRYPHLGRMGFASPDDCAHVEAALEALQLGALAERPYPTLSSGERQRVGIARLFCQDPAVMLLDEPTARLDPAHALQVARLLRAAAASGKAVLAVVHDLDLAAKLADRLVVLAGGHAETGSPDAMLTPERVARVWGVRARRVDDGRPALVLDPL